MTPEQQARVETGRGGAVIRLRTFGEATIEAGGRRIGPGWERGFALALYLAVERDKRTPRATLQALLFPGSTDRNASHNLRQLIYRLRQLQVPIEADGEGVGLREQSVLDDFSEALGTSRVTPGQLDSLAGGFLPGYLPALSEDFTDWYDAFCASVTLQLRRLIIDQLSEYRARADWRLAERAARACLSLDPLNEEGTLALAESMAMTGSKAQALALLNRFVSEVSPLNASISLPAVVLRRRISERIPDIPLNARYHTPCFVGRTAELEAGLHILKASKSSRTQLLCFEGPIGIGKSRIADEVSANALLQGFTCIRLTCRGSDTRRGLSTVTALIPELLNLPGAIGSDAQSLGCLQRLTGVLRIQEEDNPKDSEHLLSNTTTALHDVLESVVNETPLLIVIDDCHWLDEESRTVMLRAANRVARGLCLVFCGRTDSLPSLKEESRTASNVTIQKLGPLAKDDAAEIATRCLPAHLSLDVQLVQWCVATAAGNPLYLVELARHQKVAESKYSVPISVHDLMKDRISHLPDAARVVLAAAAMLSRFCTPRLLATATEIPTFSLVQTLQLLEAEGFIQLNNGIIQCSHSLVSENAIRSLQSTAVAMLSRSAAKALEGATSDGRDGSALWTAADHWIASGENAEALRALRRCSRLSTDAGLLSRALDALTRAIDLAITPSDRRELITELIAVADRYCAWDSVLSAAQRFEREFGSPDASVDLAHAAARFVTGKSLAPLRDSLLAVMNSRGNKSTDRLRAARLLLINAEHMLTPSDAEMVYAAAISIDNDHNRSTDRHRSALELIFHTTFGDLTIAEKAAQSLIPENWPANCDNESDRLVGNAAFALYRLGHVARANGLLIELYGRATERGIFSEAHRSAAMLSTVALDSGDIQGAITWIQSAEEAAARSNVQYLVGGHASNKIRLAIQMRDVDAAEILLSDARQSFQTISDGRNGLIAVAYELRIDQLRDRYALSPEVLHALIESHEHARHFGMHDDVMAAVWYALIGNNQRDLAESLLREYVHRYRRDRFPLPPELKELDTEISRSSGPRSLSLGGACAISARES